MAALTVIDNDVVRLVVERMSYGTVRIVQTWKPSASDDRRLVARTRIEEIEIFADSDLPALIDALTEVTR